MQAPDNCFIKVPSDKLSEAVKKAFDLSRPQGMGFLHHQPGELSQEELDYIIGGDLGKGRMYLADMDYVRGRSCKFHIRPAQEDGYMLIEPRWYDHSDEALEELLKHLDVEDPAQQMADACKNRDDFYTAQRY